MCRQNAWRPIAQHEGRLALLPDARLDVIEDAGHFAPVGQPDAVAGPVAGFLGICGVFSFMECRHRPGEDTAREAHRPAHHGWVKSGGNGAASTRLTRLGDRFRVARIAQRMPDSQRGERAPRKRRPPLRKDRMKTLEDRLQAHGNPAKMRHESQMGRYAFPIASEATR